MPLERMICTRTDPFPEERFVARVERVDSLVQTGAALEAAIAALPAWRRKKCEGLMFEADRRRSVAVWLLLEQMRAKLGNLPFSLSHSEDCVMVAIAEGPVGCDIEKLAPVKDGIMEEALTPAELRFVYAQPTLIERSEAFYRLWTRKESYVKAIGKGFAVGPTTFSVLPDASPPGAKFYDYPVADGYLASVCRLVK